MSFDKPAIVIDNGSRYIKAGFACDNHPVSIFRTVVGRPKHLLGRYVPPSGRLEYYDVLVGDDAIARLEDYDLDSPVQHGRVVNWDNMERIWHHIFYRELRAAPEDRAVILGVSPTTPLSEKIKCCHVFFEVLNAPALCIQPQCVLSLYGSGYTTGITVDLGYDSAEVDPVYEGGSIGYAHVCTGFSGRQISEYISKSLEERNIRLGVNTIEYLDDVMKNIYVTNNAAMVLKDHKRYYKLPDGKVIDISQEAFLIGEMFFQPDLVEGKKSHYMPVHEAIVTASLKCDSDLRSEMYNAVVTAGGLSMIPGFNDRLEQELENALRRPVNVLRSDEACVVPWLGAATFAGMPEGRKLWVTKKQFEEYGEKIVRNKFL